VSNKHSRLDQATFDAPMVVPEQWVTRMFASNLFWRWLSDQPAFVEVGIGVAFLLFIAPAVLTIVAIVFTRAEFIVERTLSARFLHSLPSARSIPFTLTGSVQQGPQR
jgi:hypothetical protein